MSVVGRSLCLAVGLGLAAGSPEGQGLLSHHHLPWRRRPRLSTKTTRYTVDDELGMPHEVWFTNFAEPLRFALLKHTGPAERSLLLLARIESIARENHILADPDLPRLFGLYWQNSKDPEAAHEVSAAAVVVREDANRVDADDVTFVNTRLGPHLVMHYHGPHSGINHLYHVIFDKAFPKFGLRNRTQEADSQSPICDCSTTEPDETAPTTTDDDSTDDDSTEDTDDTTTTEKPKKKGKKKRRLAKRKPETTTTTEAESDDDDDDDDDEDDDASSDPLLEEYGLVPSTSIAWSDELMTVVYVPIASIPSNVNVEPLT